MDNNIWNLSDRDWEVQISLMYLKLKKAINRNYERLLILQFENALHEVAWLTRNLLELLMWVEYCSKPDNEAREFWDDSIRDLYSLVHLKEQNPEVTNLIQKAVSVMATERRPEAWKSVSNAAKAIGRKKFYELQSQMLSKFVHPTAFSVLLPLPGGSQKAVQDQFVSAGIEFATEALKKLDASHLATFHTKYKEAIEAAEKDAAWHLTR